MKAPSLDLKQRLMIETGYLFVFTISEQRCSLPLRNVERVVRMGGLAVADGSLNNYGLIAFHGLALPVLNVRTLVHPPDAAQEADVSLDNELILRTHPVGLWHNDQQRHRGYSL